MRAWGDWPTCRRGAAVHECCTRLWVPCRSGQVYVSEQWWLSNVGQDRSRPLDICPTSYRPCCDHRRHCDTVGDTDARASDTPGHGDHQPLVRYGDHQPLVRYGGPVQHHHRVLGRLARACGMRRPVRRAVFWQRGVRVVERVPRWLLRGQLRLSGVPRPVFVH